MYYPGASKWRRLSGVIRAAAGLLAAAPPVTAQTVYVSLYDANGSVAKIVVGSSTTTLASGLVYPTALALDSAGNVYATSESGNIVAKITSAGVVTTWGTGLSNPEALALDGSGNLYVANLFGTTVAKISSSGGAATTFGTLPTGASGQGIAVDTSGNVFVGTAQGAIYRFSSNGVRNSTPLVSGYAGGISALAFNGSGQLFFAANPDAVTGNNRIYRISPNDSNPSASVFAGPFGVGGLAFDSTGNLFATDLSADSRQNTVFKISPDGATITTLASGLAKPRGIAVQPSSAPATPPIVNEAVGVPTITTQPQSQSVRLGGTASFNVVATGGGLSYQTRTAFDPAKLGNPTLTRQRKERSLRKQAALLGFSLQPADAGAVS